MSADDRVRYWRDRTRGFQQEAKFYKEEHDHLLKWFNERVSEDRWLRDRCNYLYGIAAQLGASNEQLAGGPQQRPPLAAVDRLAATEETTCSECEGLGWGVQVGVGCSRCKGSGTSQT